MTYGGHRTVAQLADPAYHCSWPVTPEEQVERSRLDSDRARTRLLTSARREDRWRWPSEVPSAGVSLRKHETGLIGALMARSMATCPVPR